MEKLNFKRLSRNEMKNISGSANYVTVKCSKKSTRSGTTLSSSNTTLSEANAYATEVCGAGNYSLVCVGDC